MPLRILYLITELDPGGAEKQLFHLASGLDRSRFEPRVLCLRGFGEVGTRLRAAGIPADTLGMKGKWDVRAPLRLKAMLEAARPDILHSFLFHANMLGRLVARRAGVRVVIGSVRVCETRRHHLLWDRLTQGQMDMETCVCEAVRAWTEEEAGIDPRKLVTIPNGVELPVLDAPDRRTPDALFVGRLEPQKDVRTLLAAWPLVRRRVHGARLRLIGRGPEEAALRAAATDGVEFLGYQADVAPWWRGSRALVLPSLWEGLPNVVLEAMSWSLPVIATAVGGSVELVREGETGFLVPPGDPVALADRVARVLEEGNRAREMGAAGRAVVARDYTMERMIGANEALYERLAAPRSGI
ncbi:MAG: glycosyltransferase [Candidatus Brocadiae bacterium]|nr:glycosyltransferase [Candidatus Brocadiia bacterium]